MLKISDIRFTVSIENSFPEPIFTVLPVTLSDKAIDNNPLTVSLT